MSKKLTIPQRYVLQTCADHGGVLMVGGIDGANVKRSVVNRMMDAGMLKSIAPSTFYSDEYVLTEAGKSALATLLNNQD